jgi:5-methylcytosine-specific restriction endonuclease McrA
MALSLFDAHLYTCTSVKHVRANQLHHLIALTYVEQDQYVYICCHDPNDTIRQYGPLPCWDLQRTWSKENLIGKDDAGQ